MNTCWKTTLALMLVLGVGRSAVALAPWVTDEERAFMKQGVTDTQIKEVVGLGEDNPVADNSTAVGKAQNRRVEVYLYASPEMIQQAEAGTLQ